MRGKTSSSQLDKPGVESWESEAIRSCQAGSPEAFARLVDHYRQWVFALIFRWVGRKEVAEEMVQEVFLKAFAKIKGFRGEAKFSSWLYQITRNRCLDFWRSREFRNGELEIVDFEPPEAGLALSPQAEEELQQKRRNQNLRRVLESLPAHYREALTMRYLHELSYAEMAELSGEGISKLKMRVLRGLDVLKTKISEHDHE